MADWVIEPLNKLHHRATFSCGQSSLDDFLRDRVTQYEKRKLGKTFVVVMAGEKQVLGYYTLAAGAIAFQNLPPEVSRKLPKHPVPSILLARLAVDSSAKGKGLGAVLLFDALSRVADVATNLGVYAVEVDAIDESAASFYAKHGFIALADAPLHLFMPIAILEKLRGD